MVIICIKLFGLQRLVKSWWYLGILVISTITLRLVCFKTTKLLVIYHKNLVEYVISFFLHGGRITCEYMVTGKEKYGKGLEVHFCETWYIFLSPKNMTGSENTCFIYTVHASFNHILRVWSLIFSLNMMLI